MDQQRKGEYIKKESSSNSRSSNPSFTNNFSTIVGFVLENGDDTENFFVAKTLQELHKSHWDKLPILDIQKTWRVNQDEFENFDYSPPVGKSKAAVGRFVTAMKENGWDLPKSLNPKPDSFVITTHRKVLLKIISKDKDSKEVSLKVKDALILTENASKEKNPDEFGHKFEAFMLHERSKDNRKFGLFSIHAISIRGRLILYNSQVDAIDFNDATGVYSLVEIKTRNVNKLSDAANLLRYPGRIVDSNNIQARLGLVDRVLIGTWENGNAGKILIGSTNIPIDKKSLMKHEECYLDKLVEIVENEGISPQNPLPEKIWNIKKYHNNGELLMTLKTDGWTTV